MAIAGALLELAAAKAMEMRLGQLLGEPYPGSLFECLAVYRVGTQSAADPKYTVVPQRERAARISSKATTRLSGS